VKQEPADGYVIIASSFTMQVSSLCSCFNRFYV